MFVAFVVCTLSFVCAIAVNRKRKEEGYKIERETATEKERQLQGRREREETSGR